LVPQGTYTISASKNGYETSIKTGVVVNHMNATEVNFVLTLRSTPNGQISYPIDYAIRYAVREGIVAGQIDVQQNENELGSLFSATITYDISVAITVQSATTKTLSFIVNGSQNSSGNIIAVRFGPGTLEDKKNITVLYDNIPISWVDFDTLFDVHMHENMSNATWTSVLAIDHQGKEILYCLIYIPHYSEHTITIQTITQAIVGLGLGIAVLLFSSVFLVLGVLYFIPYFYVRARKNK
jgi:hypothetical protein